MKGSFILFSMFAVNSATAAVEIELPITEISAKALSSRWAEVSPGEFEMTVGNKRVNVTSDDAVLVDDIANLRVQLDAKLKLKSPFMPLASRARLSQEIRNLSGAIEALEGEAMRSKVEVATNLAGCNADLSILSHLDNNGWDRVTADITAATRPFGPSLPNKVGTVVVMAIIDGQMAYDSAILWDHYGGDSISTENVAYGWDCGTLKTIAHIFPACSTGTYKRVTIASTCASLPVYTVTRSHN
ncbi:MAG: hypothetical protein HYV17_08460 [Xanthomonadales bacterium]|nr:hypothetical protein [Xanthomonadales bacterium]